MAGAIRPSFAALASGGAELESEDLFDVGECCPPLAVAVVGRKSAQGLVLAHGSHAGNPKSSQRTPSRPAAQPLDGHGAAESIRRLCAPPIVSRAPGRAKDAACRSDPSPWCFAPMMHRCICVMLCIMRTTISLDDQLARQVRRAAAARGLSVSAFISGTLNDALKRSEPSEPPPFRLVTVRGVRPRPGVDLDRPRALDAQEDEAGFTRGRR